MSGRLVTTVVAVARDGYVAMAADTVTNVYDRPIIGAAQKIVRGKLPAGGEYLLGMSGDGALGGLLRAHLTIPDDPGDPQVWAAAIARRVTEVSAEYGCQHEGRLDGNLILGMAGRLWTVCHMQAIPHADGVAAIGSGEGPAIGAVDALLPEYQAKAPTAPTVEVLRKAVLTAAAIAIARDRYSELPITVETIGPEETP